MNKNSVCLQCFVFSCLVLFLSPSVYSQTSPGKKKSMVIHYGKKFKLKVAEEFSSKDSLSIVLKSFSHKRPMVGGPTKATAYLTITKGKATENIELSVHGTEGVSAKETYDTVEWKEFKIQLLKFEYERSIELIITRKK